MPRNGSDVYSKPTGTTAAPNTTITSAQFNSTIDDLVADANVDRPVAAGGTGASTPAAALTNLGVGTGNSPTFAGLTVGPIVATSIDALKASTNTSGVRIAGGNTGASGANIELYGGAHATFPDELYYDAAEHVFRTQAGAEIARVHANGATNGFFVGIDNHIDPAVAEYGVTMTPEGAFHVSRSGGNPMIVKRDANGSLVSFYIGSTAVGSISSSAGVVSYNAFRGSHVTQIEGSPDIMRGTIMETTDALCDFPGGRYAHLPKCKIGETFRSKRVYGVWDCWIVNENDGALEGMVASLGADVIRIAPGEKVNGGDLIECAGDGMGRAQDDDDFHAWTVAKVTTGIAIETYLDGSYLVPCTLHCG